MEEVFIPITFFGMFGFVLWKFFDTRHKERMAVIERGVINEELKHLFGKHGEKTWKFFALKFGLLILFIGLGVIISGFLSAHFPRIADQITTGSVFLSGGLGLVLYYFIASKYERDRSAKE